MAYPASQKTLREALEIIDAGALRLKDAAQKLRDDSAAGNTARTRYPGLLAQVNNVLSQWAAVATLPGLAQYARDQKNDQGFDIAAEYTAMRTAAESLRDFIVANMPQATMEFTTAQTASFRTEVDAFVATIG